MAGKCFRAVVAVLVAMGIVIAAGHTFASARVPESGPWPASAYVTHPDVLLHAATSPFSKVGRGYTTRDNVGGLVANFAKSGSVIKSFRGKANWSFSLLPTAFGRRTSGKVTAVKPVLSGKQLQYRFKHFTEWFTNGSGGLEQGITVSKAPAGAPRNPFTISMRTGGNLSMVATPNSHLLRMKSGKKTVLTYGGLGASDAGGKAVPTLFGVTGHTLVITVNDRGATYPITVDPFFFANELSAPDGQVEDWFGQSVTLSTDGSIGLVGAIGHGSTEPPDAWPTPFGGWKEMN